MDSPNRLLSMELQTVKLAGAFTTFRDFLLQQSGRTGVFGMAGCAGQGTADWRGLNRLGPAPIALVVIGVDIGKDRGHFAGRKGAGCLIARLGWKIVGRWTGGEFPRSLRDVVCFSQVAAVDTRLCGRPTT